MTSPSPSDAVLTAAYSSLSAEDSDTTCCFLVHTLRQCPPLMMTQLRLIAWWPCRLLSQRPNTPPAHHSAASGTSILLSVFLRSISHPCQALHCFAIAQNTCIDANLRSGRSCDKQLLRATHALCRVMSPLVSAWLSLASSSVICGRSLSPPSFTLVHCCLVWVCHYPQWFSSLLSSFLAPLSSLLSTAHGVAD